MVEILPREEGWGDVGRLFGQGLVQGHQQRADEMALQKAIGGLGEKASPRQILDALVGTRTYSPQAKQQALQNYLGVAEFEELQRKAREARELAQLELEEKKAERIAKAKEQEEKDKRNRAEAITTIENSNLPSDQKKALIAAAERGEFSPASARAATSRPIDTTEYDIAKNNAKRFEKVLETYQDKAISSDQKLPLLETAIVTNEGYSKPAKYWDTLLDTVNSGFLNQFKSKTGQELETIVPVSIASFGTKMQGQLTNQKINLISKKAVGLGKDKNANRLMLYLDYFDGKLDQLRSQFSNEIISKNKYGLAPNDFDAQLKEKLRPYQKMIAKDIDLLLKDKQPDSPISKLAISNQFQEQLQPGEVAVIGPDGQTYALPEEDLNLPEYKDFTRMRM